ncbi:MAG: MFS transporter, partial [Phycisphaeraceae bacterium]|nr:MFS transporter [Phycisphaeraceae bacterium]
MDLSIYLPVAGTSVPILLLVAIGLFLLGSALAGQARSMTFLVVARAIQGLGGGGVFPIGLTIIGEIFSLQQRARMQG